MVRVTSKGQATIPRDLRDRFGITAPGEVDFRVIDGRLVVEPRRSIAQLRGIAREAAAGAPSFDDLRREATAAEHRRGRRMDQVGRKR